MCAKAYHMKMKRTNYYYPTQMIDRLKKVAKLIGLPVSEIIRRAIDKYLSEEPWEK